MPRQTLVAEPLVAAGLVATYATPVIADGIEFTCTGKEVLHVKNAGGGSTNVTIGVTAAFDGLDVPDRVVAVAAGAEKFIGPLSTATHRQADNMAYVDFNVVAGVTVAVLQIP